MNIRNAAVAGQFYDADRDRLQSHIVSLLRAAPTDTATAPQALIVPHAGYMYSGQSAATAYRCLEAQREVIQRVILFGPAHRVALEGMAVPSVDAFATPLGEIALDREAVAQALTLPGVQVSDEAHRQEHSLEVQLPFLQTLLRDFTVLPIVVGYCDRATVATVMDTFWGGAETLVVISTDLSHFHSYEQAEQLDTLTCQRLVAKDRDLSGQDACGAHALNGLMSSEHCKTLQVKLVNRCNSGDTAGSKDRVVGYGAFILH